MKNPNQKELKQRVLVEIYSNHPKVFDKLRGYLSYLNEILSKQTKSGLYIEEMARGLLYIYKNFEVMKKMNKPGKPFVKEVPQLNGNHKKQRQQKNKPVSEQSTFFLNEDITKDNFPLEGITIYFVAKSQNEEDVLKVFEDFINFNKIKDFKLERTQGDTLKATFSTYPAFVNYCKNVEGLFAMPL